MKESEELKSKKRKPRFEEEQMKLKEITEKLVEQPTEEIKQLEELSFTIFKQIKMHFDLWSKFL